MNGTADERADATDVGQLLLVRIADDILKKANRRVREVVIELAGVAGTPVDVSGAWAKALLDTHSRPQDISWRH